MGGFKLSKSKRPLESVLIANRGEIAVRIMRACADLGIKSIAVHSPADRGALHVRSADKSVELDDGPASSNYLNGELIVNVAREAGADAIHPGYGFLSENAEFADLVQRAGLIFIGPPASAIKALGEKTAAREIARQANVPVVPGSDGAVESPDDALDFATTFGLPILIKAAHGGGGRGMRRVDTFDSIQEEFLAASREAKAAFGTGDVYIERYLDAARHVEVQLFADQQGNVCWLGDRDCSVQRRHQKLVEEAPAPNLSNSIRKAMGEAAVRLARHVDYEGAGTVEFLVQDEAFYFLEMNTRIQVEHPVTEEVLGIDLIAEQIRVSRGEPLSITSSGPAVSGHAIQARINAESFDNGNFLPTPGLIEKLLAPAGEGIRFDAGYASGDQVLSTYDSLIGKLIAWGPDRSTALKRLANALEELTVIGVPTTAAVTKKIISHPDFIEGRITTGWLESSINLKEFLPDSQEDLSGDSNFVGAESGTILEVLDRSYFVPYVGDDDPQRPGRLASRARPVRKEKTRSKLENLDGQTKVRASMQGTIIRIDASSGALVKSGDVLFVVEAMKMENPVRAPFEGQLGVIEVAVGQSVAAGHVLVEITRAEQ